MEKIEEERENRVRIKVQYMKKIEKQPDILYLIFLYLQKLPHINRAFAEKLLDEKDEKKRKNKPENKVYLNFKKEILPFKVKKGC